jgi:regulation of enolase protein 1 (concanavalin A-like superfamily)
MTTLERFTSPGLPAGFYWFNEPPEYALGNGLEIRTGKETDFWQNTHYGFQRDDGHCLFVERSGDFSLVTHVEFKPRTQYDQCGLMIRADANNWLKVSTEYEDEAVSRLGSVVTNRGYSDWATRDIDSSHKEMWYRIRKRGQDFLIEHSFEGRDWLQMRVAHLHLDALTLQAGVYGCSPIGEAFWCRFSSLAIGENDWFPHQE